MTGSADLIVIGGGIVGVSVACSAAEKGAHVILLERSKIGLGCSYENAGLIVPGYALPLARPKAIRDFARILIGGRKSFEVTLRWDIGLLKWIAEFMKACHRERMKSTIEGLAHLGKANVEILNKLSTEMPPFGLKRRGWLLTYRTYEGWQQAK